MLIIRLESPFVVGPQFVWTVTRQRERDGWRESPDPFDAGGVKSCVAAEKWDLF
jgi:hypothetical protein